MSEGIAPERLLLVEELAKDSRVKRLLEMRALRGHLARRATNGLAESGVVRVAANGRLLVDGEGFVAWLYRVDRPSSSATP